MPLPLRILCFGDSLTSGFHKFGLESHPYSDRLSQILSQEVDVTTNGKPGDVATWGRWQERFEQQFEQAHFDWVLLLGGSNDLAYGIASDEVFEHLERSYSHALKKGAKVLGMTIPETKAKTKSLDQRRSDINSKILNHKHKDFYPFDLRSKIPYHSLSAEEKKLYWDDGLHLTEKGYAWMGTHIGNALQQIIEREKLMRLAKGRAQGLKGLPSSKQMPSERDEFEEEAGSPEDIRQGYVVVRKKDLD